MGVDSLPPEADPDAQIQIHYKPEETPVTLAAKRTYLRRVYLSWARYPVTETQQLVNDPAGLGPANNGPASNGPVSNGRAAYVVRFRDLPYDSPGRNARVTLVAMVFLTRDLQVVEPRS